MAALTTTLQLLFLGALISPVYLQDACNVIKASTTTGSFNLSVSPSVYKANTNYSVTISGVTNSSSVMLQALNAQNVSVGDWLGGTSVNCSNGQLSQQNLSSSSATVQWKSPSNETAPVRISVFVTVTNTSTLLQTFKLNAESTTPSTTLSVATTKTSNTMTSTTKTTNSVSTAQASFFLVAAIQLLSIFNSKLFSC